MAVERSTYFITSAVLLAFSVAYVFSYWISSKRNRYLTSNFSLVLYMTLLLFICVICMLRYLIPRQTSSWEIQQEARQSTHAHRKNRTVISCIAKCGLVIFLIGAIMFDCVSTIGLVSCMDVFLADNCYQKERMVTVINKIAKMLFMGIQATFLISESEMYVKYGRSNTSRNVYIVNSIMNFTFVIFNALQEVKSANKGVHGVYCVSPSLLANASMAEKASFQHQYDCINDRTHMDKAAIKIGPYLYPFHSEFCTMATTLNLILWKLFSNDKLKNDATSTRKCRRRRRIRSQRIHPHVPIMSPNLSEATPDGDDMTSLERRRLLENEETAFENEIEENDSDFDISLTTDRTFERIASFGRDNEADSPDIAVSTTSRHDQVGESEGYGSMDGNHTSTRGPASDSQEAGCSFPCCRDQCRGCLDPRPRQIYGPDNGCGFIAFASLALLCVETVMSLLLQSRDMRRKLFTPLYVISTAKMSLMLITSVFLAEISRRKLQTGPKVKQTLSVGSIVLIISAFIIFLYRVIEGVAALDLLILAPNSTKMDARFIADHEFTLEVQNILDFFNALLYIAQAAIQTNLVLRIHWIMKRNWPDDVIASSTAMQFTTFLMAANFSQWLLGTVVEMKYPKVNFSQVLYYNGATWKVVVYVLYPFVIYYRFHCTMSLAKLMLWRREVKNAGQLGTRREDFLATFAYY
ncbi:uncharacterized protein LOC135494852 [Lineus longissimus]|uniref:uncharacterized protein LOC135494852 n=1 Tax=Lineus longissimus TaxID=88925 RepID=UPI00315DF847